MDDEPIGLIDDTVFSMRLLTTEEVETWHTREVRCEDDADIFFISKSRQ